MIYAQQLGDVHLIYIWTVQEFLHLILQLLITTETTNEDKKSQMKNWYKLYPLWWNNIKQIYKRHKLSDIRQKIPKRQSEKLE